MIENWNSILELLWIRQLHSVKGFISELKVNHRNAPLLFARLFNFILLIFFGFFFRFCVALYFALLWNEPWERSWMSGAVSWPITSPWELVTRHMTRLGSTGLTTRTLRVRRPPHGKRLKVSRTAGPSWASVDDLTASMGGSVVLSVATRPSMRIGSWPTISMSMCSRSALK